MSEKRNVDVSIGKKGRGHAIAQTGIRAKKKLIRRERSPGGKREEKGKRPGGHNHKKDGYSGPCNLITDLGG